MANASFFYINVTTRYMKTVVLKTRYRYLKKSVRNLDLNKVRS